MAELDNMPTAASTDVDLAVAMLLYKAKEYDRLFAYYEGNQPLVYSYERLKDVFDSRYARFTQNWCAVVVDSVLERLTLQRITVADNEAATKQLDMLLKDTELLLEADDVHLAAMVTGEAYVIVWPDEASKPEAYYHDPRTVHVFYEADKPRVKRFAAKWWIGDDDHRYLTLYYPDRLEYYRSMNRVRQVSNGLPTVTNDVTSGKGFERINSEMDSRHTYGIVPVFHFRRERRTISSELQNIIYPQDAVNKLLADMMVAAEFGAFKQRWIISNADTSKLKNSPNAIWELPAADRESEQPTAAGEFDITPLENYLKSIEDWRTSVAIISRTPKHYFFAQGGDPSGEALIAMEAPLNHKAQKYIDRFIVTWSELAQFMGMLGGMGELPIDGIIPVYDKPQTVQPYTEALILKEETGAGLPLMWLMKKRGYTEQELADLEKARQQVVAEQQEQMAQAMTNAERNFDRGDSDDE